MNTVIATERLTKQFNGVPVVDGISLQVDKGEVYGFVGLNGAGKTTTIRMLLGMIRPTSGCAYVMGEPVDAGRHDLWQNVGYMVETPRSYPELTVRQNLEVVRRLRRLPHDRSIGHVMDRLRLTPYRDKKAAALSMGNKQRLGLAKALLHEPAILLLDEPTNGLDPAGIAEVRDMLRDLAVNQGVTVFLSSHLLGEVAKLVTRLGIIHAGRLVQDTDSDRLHHLLRKRLVVKTRDVRVARHTLQQSGYDVHVEEDTCIVTGESAVHRPEEVATALVHAGVPPVLLTVETEDLEAYFLRTIGKGETETNESANRHIG